MRADLQLQDKNSTWSLNRGIFRGGISVHRCNCLHKIVDLWLFSKCFLYQLCFGKGASKEEVKAKAVKQELEFIRAARTEQL